MHAARPACTFCVLGVVSLSVLYFCRTNYSIVPNYGFTPPYYIYLYQSIYVELQPGNST